MLFKFWTFYVFRAPFGGLGSTILFILGSLESA